MLVLWVTQGLLPAIRFTWHCLMSIWTEFKTINPVFLLLPRTWINFFWKNIKRQSTLKTSKIILENYMIPAMFLVIWLVENVSSQHSTKVYGRNLSKFNDCICIWFKSPSIVLSHVFRSSLCGFLILYVYFYTM